MTSKNASETTNAADPIDLMFGGMEKLGPGSDEDTLHVLRLLPKRDVGTVVDAGCGSGRQTLVLAGELGAPIHAIDTHEPFLRTLRQQAAAAGLEALVQTHCMDMGDIPNIFRKIDLLWSEGAAYNIGFANALTTWAPAISRNGFAVVSELAWLCDQPHEQAGTFFQSAYPDMRHADENIAIAERAGYEVLQTYVLPRQSWVDGYYAVLEPRAKALINHEEPVVRALAQDTIREIEIFNLSPGSYGYVFYILRRDGA